MPHILPRRISLLVLPLLFAALPVMAQPQLAFERGGYWLVNPVASDYAVRTSDIAKARFTLYRITDPELLTQIMTARATRSLGESELLRRVAEKDKPFWQADMVLKPGTGEIVTRLPLDVAAGPLPGGVYVLTASDAAEAEGAPQRVAQWFMKSPLDMHAKLFAKQALVTVYDMNMRATRADARVAWLDAQGKVLAEGKTDENGAAWLEKPDGAVMLMAGDPVGGDVTFRDISATEPQPVLPGALVETSVPIFTAGQQVGFIFIAPGLGENAEMSAKFGDTQLQLQPVAPGIWQASGKLDAPLGDADISLRNGRQLLLRKTLPFAAQSDVAVQWVAKPQMLLGDKKETYSFRLQQGGKPLANAKGQLMFTYTAIAGQPPLPQAPSVRLDYTTDAKGEGKVDVSSANLLMPAPVNFDVKLLVDGKLAGTPQALRLYPARAWVEIAPQFNDNAVPEGATARFNIRMHDAGGEGRAVPGTYELARETYKFEWYQAEDGRWTYKTKADLAPVMDGKIEIEKGEAVVAVPVSAGRYRISIKAANGMTATRSFTAGWWLSQMPLSTPEKINLRAQVEGDKLAVFVDPPFPARIWLTSLTGGKQVTRVETVNDEGGFVYLPLADIPAGQPLVLSAFGVPSNIGASLVRAHGVLVAPHGGNQKFGDVAIVGDKPGTALLENVDPGSRAIVEIVGKDSTLLYRGELTDESDGKIAFTLPPMAIAGEVTVRAFVVHDGRVDIIDRALKLAPQVVIDVPATFSISAGKAASLPVKLMGNKKITGKYRLLAIAAPEANLQTTPQTVADISKSSLSLPLTVAQVGQVKLTLRVESRTGEVVAERPVILSVQ